MRVGTLFSGIGAPEQALKRIYGENFELVFACEFDKFARKSFLANYSIDESHFHQDVRSMDGKQYEGKIDILIGGSPCQSYSIAGKREGLNDPRGALIYQYMRILEESSPQYFIYENVKGMLSIDNGETIVEFLKDLSRIGYEITIDVVNSKDLNVPQNRERIFIVGRKVGEQVNRHTINNSIKHKKCKDILEKLNNAKEILYFCDYRYPDKIPLIKTISDVLEENVDKKYFFKLDKEMLLRSKINSFHEDGIIDGSTFGRMGNYTKYSPCLCARDYKEPKIVKKVCAMRGRTRVYPPDLKESTKQVIEINPNGISNYITTVQKDNLIIQKSQDYRISGNLRIFKWYSPTIRAMMGDNLPMISNRFDIRNMTPLECLRFQDFPDEFYYNCVNAGVSNTQLYKQAGNSMTVKVLEELLRNLSNTHTTNHHSSLCDFE